MTVNDSRDRVRGGVWSGIDDWPGQTVIAMGHVPRVLWHMPYLNLCCEWGRAILAQRSLYFRKTMAVPMTFGRKAVWL